jgi:hypothetical protein
MGEGAAAILATKKLQTTISIYYQMLGKMLFLLVEKG